MIIPPHRHCIRIAKIFMLLTTGASIFCGLYISNIQVHSRSTITAPPLAEPLHTVTESSGSNVVEVNAKIPQNSSHTFTLLPKDVCENNLYILVCVISHVNKFDVRKQWRDFMRNVSLTDLPAPINTLGYRMVFLVAQGKPDDNANKTRLEKEHMDHADILQVGFQEQYHKLVFKSLAMLDWFYESCRRAQFLLKIDDDVFLNLPKVANILHKAQEQEKKYLVDNFLLGRYEANRRPPRNKKGKWYIPRDIYSKDKLPPFVNGAAYAMSKMAVQQIRSQCAKSTPVNIEDIFLTGICREKTEVKAVYDHRFCISLRKVEYVPEICATFHRPGKHFWSYMSHKRHQSVSFDYEHNSNTTGLEL